ncbi:2-aminoethylphosphonate aminotransferase [Bacillus massilinigeriensis]|uniref:2-aminoethylphosphonate aminotransferase n=1 Tax=Bacillus massilionigeriensis TaxID=1805475 RepID=UPI00096B2A21|nr:2-aminoethylphosphonate--pyruvate transaminase [Bacillus massilionigeriensis]
MIKTAVIVAAGMGSRMGNRTADRPKGFLELEHKPIIEHSIQKLLEIGIEKILIGTGYKKEMYHALMKKYPEITCVNNPLYESTGSMYTLFVCKEHVKEDFLLLESDLIYEKNALKSLVDDQNQDVILASPFTHSGDEVFIESDSSGHLVNMSKNKEELNSIYAELLGISKISYRTFLEMCSYAEKVLENHSNIDYEKAIVGVSKDIKINILKLQEVAWCEVDDESHWERAENVIFPLIQAREEIPAPVKRNILLNPGPATTSDTVKYAQVVADICPREQEFGELMGWISKELTKFVASTEEYTTVLFGGSGTAAVESILSSVIGKDAVIIINNGAYGKRMCQIANAYDLAYLPFESAVDIPINIQQLEEFIQQSSYPISHLAVVHNETTTGLLNPIKEIGELCAKYHIQLIVDAMSSYSAIPIDMEKMNIHYLAASSNKNLQGMAGVSFVIANKEALNETRYIKPRNHYLHLYSQYEHFELTNQMRFTPPVQTLYALKQAILETKWEGIKNRYQRYTQSWETLVNGISRLGLEHIVDKSHHSKIITAIIEPAHSNYDFQKMHDFFYKNGFTIYPGKFDQQKTFRVANIGNIHQRDIERFLVLLEDYLTKI